MTFAADVITARVWFVTRSIPLATASEIRQVKAPVRTGVRQIPVGRLAVIGDRTGRLPVRAILGPAMANVEPALHVLDGWVRQRPALLAQDPQAREAFVARNAIAPETPSDVEGP